MKILDFGSLNIDDIYSLPHFVRPGETIASTAYAQSAGGKGFNQGVALRKAGCDVRFGGAMGKDGQFLADYMNELGVDTSCIEVLDVPTGHAIIQVEEAGGNCIILFGGANRCITDEMIDRALAPMEPGEYVLMQNEINAPERLIEKAHEKGLVVVLNPSPASPEIKGWPLDKVDWFILNEVEGGDLTGETDPDRILDALLARYPKCRVVLTLGEQGSVYADAGRRVRQAAFRAEAVDTTAAGDTFTGYFLAAVLEGKDIPYALKLASRASAITVSRPGAAKSIPMLDEVLEAMEG